VTRKYDSHDAWLKRETAKREDAPKPKKKTTPKEKKNMNKNPFDDINAIFSARAMPPAEPVPTPKASTPRVTWDDVIGQAEAKAAVREAVEGATKHAELYKRYGRRTTKGVLLFGPPGNGKTMLGKAASTAMADLHGQVARESGFIYVKGPEVLGSFLGESEANIRQLFARAKRHKTKHGYPALIFIDEAESLLGRRGVDGVAKFTVPTFLAEMDGMEESSAIVLLATNLPSNLDPAVVREGRIDRKVVVSRPTRKDAHVFLKQGLQFRPYVGELEALAESAVDALYDTKHVLYHVHLENGQSKTMTFAHFTSGAQIAYLIDTAATFAIEREIAGNGDGITSKDFVAAVERTVKEQRDLDHTTELIHLCEPFLKDVVEVERVRADGVRTKRSLIAQVPKGVTLKAPGGELQ
jgi:proteasome-associated ATPase